MLRKVDAHFRMGTSHEKDGTPCQDYALVGDGLPFAVVSDGCSSSGRTDIGARLLALAAGKMLGHQEVWHCHSFCCATLDRAFDAAATLGVGPRDLDATLGMVKATGNGGAQAMLFGDGMIAAKTKNGIEITTVDWAGNMPGYPAYYFNQTERRLFYSQSETFAAAEGRAACRVDGFILTPDGVLEQTSQLDLTAEQGLYGQEAIWDDTAEVDMVCVATDGIMQTTGITPHLLMERLMSGQGSRAGLFMRRRMTRVLADLAKEGIRPVDDIAVAALAR